MVQNDGIKRRRKENWKSLISGSKEIEDDSRRTSVDG